MAIQKWSKKYSCLSLLVIIFLSSGCDGLFNGQQMNCPISTANRSTNEILFVNIVSGETKNMFGFLGPMGAGATSLGCDFELVPNTTIEWEENDKKCSAIVDTAKYIPKKREIKSFSFLYKGNGTWDVIARSDIFDDSPEVKP
jgi:hypothetical protein